MKSSIMGIIHKVWFLDQISRRGDFKSAAALVGVTPSALTQAIKSLESYFSKTLIIRNKGTVSLTMEGANLLERFRPLLADIEKIDREYSENSGLYKLRLGAYDSLAIRYLPKLYRKIKAEHPEIKIDLQVGRSADLITLIHRGHLDMALVVAPQDSDAYYATPMAYNYLSIYTHKKNLTQKEELKSLGIGCLRPEANGRQSFFVKTIDHLNLKAHDFSIQTDSFETLLALCLDGQIIAILPTNLADNHRDRLVDISNLFNQQPLKDISRHPLSIVTRKNFPLQWKHQIESCLQEISI